MGTGGLPSPFPQAHWDFSASRVVPHRPCVVVGGYGGVVGGIILTTTDAGATWMPRSGPAAVSDLQNVSCPTLKRCVATGISPSASTTAIAPVVATFSDGGVTWMSFTP